MHSTVPFLVLHRVRAGVGLSHLAGHPCFACIMKIISVVFIVMMEKNAGVLHGLSRFLVKKRPKERKREPEGERARLRSCCSSCDFSSALVTGSLREPETRTS